MSDRKAINKYYPPDWDPKYGSVNRYHNSHHLRSRARKLDDGILVIRFEMPFNIWCSNCKNHIGMGVRYNAEKSKVGNYYSSPIYKFRMKCHLCDNRFEIQSNPAKLDYDLLSGGKKQCMERNDSDTYELDNGSQTSSRNMCDAMFRLETKVEDQKRVEEQQVSLYELKQSRTFHRDTFELNQIVRKQFRERRKRIEETKSKDRDLLRRTSLKIPLVKPNEADKVEALKLLKQTSTPRLERIEKHDKMRILNSHLFRSIERKDSKYSNFDQKIKEEKN